MTETPQGPELPEIPAAVAVPRRRWSPSLVWLIPIVAAVIGGWLAVKGILERGPTVTIGFNTAEGLEAGKTRIKYKDVDIGLVKSIALAEDRKGVVVTAELTKQAEDFLVEDTRFWVVRPRVAGGSVSGIGTLFSGAYIGFDAGKSAVPRREFTGLETPPVVTAGLPGRHFILTSEDLGFLDIGAPIYFRRIPVGQVVAFELDKDGAGVTFKIFINAPYDRYVTGNTRFWQASGVDVTLDAGGFRVNTESLASILTPWRSSIRTRWSKPIAWCSRNRCAGCRWGRRWIFVASSSARWRHSTSNWIPRRMRSAWWCISTCIPSASAAAMRAPKWRWIRRRPSTPWSRAACAPSSGPAIS
ncbi:MAG: hypothetical protein H6R11_2033 [Proteobacteria bacterium]|nr:hypothetical protein [Pseudomonadota bacterium]